MTALSPLSSQNPQYNWSPKIQGVILSSILYGLLAAQIPTAYLSGFVSVRKMVGCSLLLCSLLSLLVPPMAAAGEAFVIACRALQGLSQVCVGVPRGGAPLRRAPQTQRPAPSPAGDRIDRPACDLDQVGASPGARPNDLH